MGDTQCLPWLAVTHYMYLGRCTVQGLGVWLAYYRRYIVAPFLSYPSVANKVWYWLRCVCTLMCDSLQHLGLSFDREMWFTDHIAVN